MRKNQSLTLWARIKAAVRALQGKPVEFVHLSFPAIEKRERHTQTYYGAKTACISIAEGLTPEHKKVLLEACGRQIIEKMIEEDALAFQVIPGELFNDLTQVIEIRAAIEVVMPEKDEEVEA